MYSASPTLPHAQTAHRDSASIYRYTYMSTIAVRGTQTSRYSTVLYSYTLRRRVIADLPVLDCSFPNTTQPSAEQKNQEVTLSQNCVIAPSSLPRSALPTLPTHERSPLFIYKFFRRRNEHLGNTRWWFHAHPRASPGSNDANGNEALQPAPTDQKPGKVCNPIFMNLCFQLVSSASAFFSYPPIHSLTFLL